MSAKSDKLLERMRNSKSGWTRNDLDALYTGFGFVIKNSSGPHDMVVHPEFPILVTYLPRHRRLAIYIVDQAIHMIERLQILERERDERAKKP